jgi:hypothetical protein
MTAPDGLYRGSTFLGNDTDTGLRAEAGENWLVPCDRPGGGTFLDWWDSLPVTVLARDALEMGELAWAASRERHTAALRRIGWLDQHGRVWLEPPEGAAQGAFVPLLIDAREGTP